MGANNLTSRVLYMYSVLYCLNTSISLPAHTLPSQHSLLLLKKDPRVGHLLVAKLLERELVLGLIFIDLVVHKEVGGNIVVGSVSLFD